MILPLTNDEKSRLQRLNLQKEVVFALKKLFLSVCVKKPASTEAIEKVSEAFHDLEMIQPDIQTGQREGNLV
jgi:hypothetical protein